jgi:hypothetical protein
LKFSKESILILALVSLAGIATAQTPSLPARFAIEFSGPPPLYNTVRDSCAKSFYPCSSLFYGGNHGSLPRLPGFHASASQPSALRLEYKPAADGVSIKVTVFYGDFNRQDTPVSLEKLPRKTLGSYFVKLNQSVTLSDLAKVGLEPITLRVVSAPTKNPWRPILHSDAPSLAIDYKQLDRSFGVVTIHNFSNKGVAALIVWASDVENGKYGGGEGIGPGPGSKPAIAPGGTYQMQFGVPVEGRMVHGVYVALPPDPFLTLKSVLFEDGSYEGDERAAEGMAAQRLGLKVQVQRVLSLAKPIIANAQTDDAAKLRAIRAAIGQLSDEPEAQMILGLRAEFGNLTPAAVAYVRRQISSSMREAKQLVDNQIKENQDNLIRAQQLHLSFAQWWALSVVRSFN